MELFEFARRNDFEAAMLRRYDGDPFFINNKSGVFGIVSNPKGAFFRSSVQRMIGVRLGGDVLCQCVLIRHRNFDKLMVSFFEAAPNASEAVDMMMTYAAEYGKNAGLSKLIVALDGHCDYSIGFSYGDHAAPPLFGESRNPSHYHDYFQNGYTRYGFSSFWGDFEEICESLESIMSNPKKLAAGISIECADLKRFRSEMARFTDLDNSIFSGHDYHYHREYDEGLELFRSLKPLMSPHNLIFARKDGKDIGCMLLYPDFNELVPIGKKAGIVTVLRHKLLNRRIYTVKIALVAVAKEHRASGAVFALFAKACRQIRQRHPHTKRIVSSWISDDNHASRNTTTRFAPNLYERYSLYEKTL